MRLRPRDHRPPGWEPRLKAYVQGLQGETTGHDLHHALRVRNLAVRLAAAEGADAEVVIACAYLHDINRLRDGPQHGLTAARDAGPILERVGFPPAKTAQVIGIIQHHEWSAGSYRLEAGPLRKKLGLEFLVFVDADRLDAMGAVGIARTFAFGAVHDRVIWQPEPHPTDDTGACGECTLCHFQHKLLRLRDRMHTETGRKLAGARHRFMLSYLEQFHREWEGEA